MAASWVKDDAVELDGVNVHCGEPVKVDGLRGSWELRRHVQTETSEWVEVYGGTSGKERLRSFTRERVHPARKKRRR